MTEKDHKAYIKKQGEFAFSCNRTIFIDEEINLVIKYGHWFKALQSGTLLPLNEEQRRFVEVANFQAEPITQFEKVWWKYLKRQKIEIDNKDILNVEPKLEQDSFYSRDMAKKHKGQMFGIISANHKK